MSRNIPLTNKTGGLRPNWYW